MSETPSWEEVANATVEPDPETDGEVIVGEVVEEGADTAVDVPEMSVDEATKLTGWIKSSTEMLSVLLFRAREGKAWKALGYDDWDAYCVEEFGFTGSTGYRKAIHGEVVTAITDHVPEGTEVKLSQKDAHDIRELLPAITEAIDDAVDTASEGDDGDADDADIDIDAIINEALSASRAAPTPSEEPAPEPGLGLSTSGLDASVDGDSPAAARATASKQHAEDAAGAVSFDGYVPDPEDVAAITGKTMTAANAVRSFTTWNEKLPDAVDAARTFRDDSVDVDFVAELPSKLRGVRNWIDRFLAEFEKVGDVAPAAAADDDITASRPEMVIEELDDTDE